jgi:RimJ/RimL family protein N-acetyltransferase
MATEISICKDLDVVKFRDMNHEEYLEYKDYVVKELADALVKGGFVEASISFERALKEQNEVLPNDEKTEKNYLYIIENEVNDIGCIWFGEIEIESDKIAYIFDVMINEEYRNKGYAYYSMIEIENRIQKLGYKKIQLYVLDENESALKLYKKCGYTMIKENDKGKKLEKVL